MKKLNVAVIGIGHLGSRHLKIYSELADKVDIAGICDIKTARTKKFAGHYNVPLVRNHKDLIGKIDAVSICTPTISHYAVAKDFLENGIHALIEKPIAATIDEAEKLEELAKKRDLRLQVGHVERFNSAFVAIQKLAQSPHFVECHRLNHFSGRSLDIGVVMDLMIHDIDIILGLNTSPVKRIDAVGVKVLTQFEDIANARITFENGCVCNLTASRISDDVTRKIRIFTKNSYISLDYVNQEAHIYKKFGKIITKHALPIQKEEPLKQEIEHFLDCVRTNKKPIVSAVEGRDALKMALKITDEIWKNPKNT